VCSVKTLVGQRDVENRTVQKTDGNETAVIPREGVTLNVSVALMLPLPAVGSLKLKVAVIVFEPAVASVS
jgi:hypothetical protein